MADSHIATMGSTMVNVSGGSKSSTRGGGQRSALAPVYDPRGYGWNGKITGGPQGQDTNNYNGRYLFGVFDGHGGKS